MCVCVRSRRITTRWPRAPLPYDTLTGAVNEQKLRLSTFPEVFYVGNRGNKLQIWLQFVCYWNGTLMYIRLWRLYKIKYNTVLTLWRLTTYIYIYIHVCRTAQLTSRRCILNIYSTNILTEYFKHAAHSPFVSLQDAVYFIMLPFLVPVIFTF